MPDENAAAVDPPQEIERGGNSGSSLWWWFSFLASGDNRNQSNSRDDFQDVLVAFDPYSEWQQKQQKQQQGTTAARMNAESPAKKADTLIIEEKNQGMSVPTLFHTPFETTTTTTTTGSDNNDENTTTTATSNFTTLNNTMQGFENLLSQQTRATISVLLLIMMGAALVVGLLVWWWRRRRLRLQRRRRIRRRSHTTSTCTAATNNTTPPPPPGPLRPKVSRFFVRQRSAGNNAVHPSLSSSFPNAARLRYRLRTLSHSSLASNTSISVPAESTNQGGSYFYYFLLYPWKWCTSWMTTFIMMIMTTTTNRGRSRTGSLSESGGALSTGSTTGETSLFRLPNEPGLYLQGDGDEEEDVVYWWEAWDNEDPASAPLLYQQFLHHYAYSGPSVHQCVYRTITPPPSWEQVSRSFLASPEADVGLQRYIALVAPVVSSNLSSSLLGTSNKTHRATGSSSSSAHMSISPIKPTSAASAAAFNSNNKMPQPSSSSKDKKKNPRHSKDGNWPVSCVGLHCRTPPESGVLEVYIKNNNDNNNSSPALFLSQWKEHTFESASEAAQFQLDLLAMQLFGDVIFNMYHMMEVIHRGSLACTAKETYLHQDSIAVSSTPKAQSEAVLEGEAGANKPAEQEQEDTSTVPVGIAWDDVMRCLGSHFPVIAYRLEALWWIQMTGAGTQPETSKPGPRRRREKPREKQDGGGQTSGAGPVTAEKGTANAGEGSDTPLNAKSKTRVSSSIDERRACLAPEYIRKRVLLGPIDFFRLFVPVLPPEAVPSCKTSRPRMEQMLRWRKRIARASVLVHAYVRARTVVNRGWNLGRPLPQDGYIRKRLAFDDESDNQMRDAVAKSEYYEGNIARDALCRVMTHAKPDQRGIWRGKDGRNFIHSAYQGYSLVGLHVFERTTGELQGLHFQNDPVLAIPSLRELMEKQPCSDFFVVSVFHDAQRVALVMVFVRSLPKGIDTSFDTSVDRFVNGSKELRDSKLEIVVQVSTAATDLSFLMKCLFYLLSLFLRLGQFRKGHISRCPADHDLSRFPAVNLVECGETRHFGGSLRSDPAAPGNYVATSINLDSRQGNGFVSRVLLCYLETENLANDVLNVIFLLRGTQEDEFPERALGTSKIVRTAMKVDALPQEYLAHGREPTKKHSEVVTESAIQDRKPTFVNILVTDPVIASLQSIRQSLSKRSDSDLKVDRSHSLTGQSTKQLMRAMIVVSSDPVERAVNAMVSILQHVRIPSHTGPNNAKVQRAANDAISPIEGGEVSILQRVTRSDMRRFLIASECKLQLATTRLIESTLWRNQKFPIDTNKCRLELQNGQFFQQGKDLEGNPVFYFRRMCLGPWRRDQEAVIDSTLHRLEASLQALSDQDPDVKCTLIVLTGRPYRKKSKATPLTKAGKLLRHAGKREGESVAGAGNESDTSSTSGPQIESQITDNPRIDRNEKWYPHCNTSTFLRLVHLVTTHYPQRLSKALVLIENRSLLGSPWDGSVGSKAAVPSSRTRRKIHFLLRYRDLTKHVHPDELATVAGGNAPLDVSIFKDC